MSMRDLKPKNKQELVARPRADVHGESTINE
jgi:hypothetical protein